MGAGISMRRTHRPLTVVALMLAIFMAAMEVTVVSTAMPTVVGDLGGVDLYAWVFAAYMLAATTAMPIAGKVSDLYGRKSVVLLGIGLFVVGSASCGQADSMLMLIVFRGLQGLGGGTMQSTSLTIVGDIFDVEERGRMMGVMGGVWAVAGIAGPFVGGLVVAELSWHWVFYLSVPFGLVSAALLVAVLHENVERSKKPLDVLGALSLTASLVVLLLAARGRFFLFPVALVLFALWVGIERRAEDPMMPFDLFRDRLIAVACVIGALVGGALVCSLTFVPLFVQGVLGGTPTEAGSAIAPMAIAWPLSSAVAGRLIPRVGFRPLVRVGLLVATSAMVGLALAVGTGVPEQWMLRVSMAAFGMGMGFANTSLLISVQNSVEWKQRGVATSAMLMTRTVGGALSVGVLGEVLRAALAADPELASRAEKLLAGGGPALEPARAAEVARALGSGLTTVFEVLAVLAGAAFLVALAYPRIEVRNGAMERVTGH